MAKLLFGIYVIVSRISVLILICLPVFMLKYLLVLLLLAIGLCIFPVNFSVLEDELKKVGVCYLLL